MLAKLDHPIVLMITMALVVAGMLHVLAYIAGRANQKGVHDWLLFK